MNMHIALVCSTNLFLTMEAVPLENSHLIIVNHKMNVFRRLLSMWSISISEFVTPQLAIEFVRTWAVINYLCGMGAEIMLNNKSIWMASSFISLLFCCCPNGSILFTGYLRFLLKYQKRLLRYVEKFPFEMITLIT